MSEKHNKQSFNANKSVKKSTKISVKKSANEALGRRNFLKSGVATATVVGLASVASVAGLASVSSPAISQNRREVKMVTTWPKNFPGLGTGAQRVADRISLMSDGRINVKLYAAGELVPAFGSFDAVSSGAAEMYHGAEYYWQGKHRAFNFFTSVPLGLTASELEAWIHYGGGQQLWDELAAKFNLKSFLAGNTGVQMGGWFNKEINSLDDMKGLKMRIPGLGGEVLRRIGASAVSLPGGEIFPALQSGAIDATEWVGPWNDLAFGFYKVTKYYYWPGFHEPGSGLAIGMNLDFWNSLSKSEQALIEAACNAENDHMFAEYNARNGDALNTLVNKHKVQLRRTPYEVFERIAKVSEIVVSETADVDDIGRRVYESYIKARDTIGGWTALSDVAYLNERRRSIGK